MAVVQRLCLGFVPTFSGVPYHKSCPINARSLKVCANQTVNRNRRQKATAEVAKRVTWQPIRLRKGANVEGLLYRDHTGTRQVYSLRAPLKDDCSAVGQQLSQLPLYRGGHARDS